MVLFHFIADIYRTGKIEEILSFVVWECMHRLRLFKKSSYFAINEKMINITIDDLLKKDEFNFTVSPGSALTIETPSISWHILHWDEGNNIWGSTITEQNVLFFQKNGKAEASKVFEFPQAIKAIYISRHREIFVCSGGKLFRAAAREGLTGFVCVLSFLADDSIFRHNNTFTETPDGTLLLGEYTIIWESGKWIFGANLIPAMIAGTPGKNLNF